MRATINLPGLPVGEVALVDADVPYIRDALASGYLVPVGSQARPPAIPDEPKPEPAAAEPTVEASSEAAEPAGEQLPI